MGQHPGEEKNDYNFVAPSEKTWVVLENFPENAGNWVGIGMEDPSGSATVSQEEGCILTSSPGKTMLIANLFDLNTEENFELETTVKLLNAGAGNQSAFSLSWGCSFDTHHQYALSLTPGGMTTVRKITHTIESLVKPRTVDGIRVNQTLKISIRKTGNTYFFYINENYIDSAPFEPFFGQGVIFTAGNNLSVAISDFRVAYINKHEEYNLPPRLAIENPGEDRSIEVEASEIMVEGIVSDEDGIRSLTINGMIATLAGQRFSTAISLVQGRNLLKIIATDNTGLQTIKYLEVIRKEPRSNFIAGEKRLAIVIGNAAYKNAAHLKNSVNDANDMATTLQSLGFTVKKYTDLEYSEMINAIRDYGNEISKYKVTLFFFAGHGMQIDNKNYILPVDALCREKRDVQFEAIEVEKVLSLMQAFDEESLHLLVLDACRNNPFRSWERGGAEGLAAVQPPSGTLIAYATSPGSFASDGTGDNGLYTSELIKQLTTSQRIEDIFINTRVEVEKRSRGQQSPWELARLRGRYYLK